MNKVNKKIVLTVDCLLIVVLTIFDQLSKKLVVSNLKGNSPYVLINGILELYYLENRGSAFGMFQNKKLFILIMSVIFMVILLYTLFSISTEKKLAHIFMSMIVAGGLGNIIDRVLYGYVVDFIYIVCINYPVFNVADCYIVIGAISFIIFFLLMSKKDDETSLFER